MAQNKAVYEAAQAHLKGVSGVLNDVRRGARRAGRRRRNPYRFANPGRGSGGGVNVRAS
jgi:hypothetical protein